jgi:hypothetical protein
MKRALAAAVSVTLLGVIYWLVDPRALLAALARADVGLLAVSVLVLALAYGLSAWRLRLLLPPGRRFPYAEALRLLLAASVLNMVLPAKAGDLAKSVFMRRRGELTGSLALALVVFEKTLDLMALLLYGLFGLSFDSTIGAWRAPMWCLVATGLLLGVVVLVSPRAADVCVAVAVRIAPERAAARLVALRDAWHELHRWLRQAPGTLLAAASLSLAVWLVHLAQIWLLARALGAPVPFLANLALAPLALIAGLMPVTLAGLGTRDAALMVLYRPFMDPATGAALGALATLRYLLPALAGLPVFQRYVVSNRSSDR